LQYKRRGQCGGWDGGTGRITGGHGGRPDNTGIVGDGIDSGGDGTSRCWSGKPVCQVVRVRDSALCDGGAGRTSGGHDGRPDDIGIVGDGIDGGGDGTRWC
jgi:hypothetical protein